MRTVPYLGGHYEPVADEITAHELTVTGTLPPELNGRYFRNGHNPKPGITRAPTLQSRLTTHAW